MSIRAGTPNDIVNQVLAYLRLRGVMAWRNNTTGVYDTVRKVFRTFHGRKGVSDVMGVLPGGKIICVECKSGTGKLTKEQAAFIDEINAAGGLAFCTKDVREVQRIIEEEMP